MQRLIRAAAGAALAASLAACVVTPPPARHHPSPRPTRPAPAAPVIAVPPPVVGADRMQEIQGRVDMLGRRIDMRVNNGNYPPPQGAALHRRLDVIHQEANDMGAQDGGGLTPDEQRVLNQELDTAARAIGE